MTRLNITLPDEIAEELAAQPNKSRFIADVLKEKFECTRKKEIETQLAEGYQAAKNEDIKINNEWEGTSLEKWE